jgi:hypothetical protein
VALGATLVLAPLLKPLRFVRDRRRTLILLAASAFAMEGSVVGLGLLRLARNGSLVALAFMAVISGVGVAAGLLSWQSIFSRLDVRCLTKVVLGACLVFPPVAAACLFLDRSVAYGVTGLFVFVSAILLLTLVAGREANCREVSEEEAPPTAAPIKSWGTTMACLGSLGFVTGISRTLTLHAVSGSTVLILESLGCMLAVAVLLAVLFKTGWAGVSPTRFYGASFFVVTTGLVAFSIVSTTFTASFAGLSYFFFELALVLETVNSVLESRDRALSPLVAYGLVVGCAYLLLGIGTAVGFVLQELDGLISSFPVAVILCLYALSMALLFQSRHRKAAARDEVADLREDGALPSFSSECAGAAFAEGAASC